MRRRLPSLLLLFGLLCQLKPPLLKGPSLSRLLWIFHRRCSIGLSLPFGLLSFPPSILLLLRCSLSLHLSFHLAFLHDFPLGFFLLLSKR